MERNNIKNNQGGAALSRQPPCFDLTLVKKVYKKRIYSHSSIDRCGKLWYNIIEKNTGELVTLANFVVAGQTSLVNH